MFIQVDIFTQNSLSSSVFAGKGRTFTEREDTSISQTEIFLSDNFPEELKKQCPYKKIFKS